MLLIEDGAMALDDPVERWLPELSARRVLRAHDAELSDTVPAETDHRRGRALVPARVRERLHAGATADRPAAEEELKLRTLGPPWPPTPHNPDQWIAALGSLPLIDQPGERFLYNTGAMVAGILIERVTGAPFAEVLSKRVFEPLGMADTAFHVPPPSWRASPACTRHARSPPCSAERGRGRTALALIDRPDGWYAAPPALPDGGAGLVSTIDDLGAFAAMLAADGGGLLSEESVAQMLRDRTTERDRAENEWFFGESLGWGLMMSVPAAGVDPRTAPADAARLRLGGRQRHLLAHRPEPASPACCSPSGCWPRRSRPRWPGTSGPPPTPRSPSR